MWPRSARGVRTEPWCTEATSAGKHEIMRTAAARRSSGSRSLRGRASTAAPSRLNAERRSSAPPRVATVAATASGSVPSPTAGRPDPSSTRAAASSKVLDVASATADGATLATGGERPDLDTGFYVAPTLVVDATNDMTIAREEVFGPVITVIPFDTEDEAIAISNDSAYGLYDYVFTEDSGKAFEVAKLLRAGNVGINTLQRNNEAAFGGFKYSGVGRDGGSWGLHAYSEMQSIVWKG